MYNRVNDIPETKLRNFIKPLKVGVISHVTAKLESQKL